MSIKFAVDIEKLKQELKQQIRQEIEQELAEKIANAEKEAKKIVESAKYYAETEIKLTKGLINEYKTIVKQTKTIIEIVKKHNIRNLANLAKTVEAGRVAREMKRANKQLIYLEDIKAEFLRMQIPVANWQKIIAKLEKYDKKYQKQTKELDIEKDDYN